MSLNRSASPETIHRLGPGLPLKGSTLGRQPTPAFAQLAALSGLGSQAAFEALEPAGARRGLSLDAYVNGDDAAGEDQVADLFQAGVGHHLGDGFGAWEVAHRGGKVAVGAGVG